MADGPTGTPPSPRDRRSSFAGQTFADLFGTSRPRQAVDAANNSPPNQPYTGPISQAAAQAQRRRMSLTTLGLSGSPEGAGSRFNSHRGRHDSISSANSGSIDESAIEDEPMPRDPTTTPVTPFARRMSFGARALRDVRNSSSGGQSGGGGTGQNGTNSPPAVSTSTSTTKSKTPNGTISSRDAKGRGSADFWNENMRNRAQRTSIAGQADLALPSPPRTAHARAVSVAALEAPIREMPKEPQRPDHFQERILKGDFYMD
ncbi:hypothetical protein LTR91_010535 [Friedmanniomyces endolithicus]|uniref:Uncharacterized protein n=1 Tax=Friedmanniomyces endolithicus TaxID=329885 RepID=A0AAN6QSX2_9PEZI|nr:hypothetical protein LTR35_006658 [Friedmanniomyces endolithicus]KAK0297079.1 hypothetical protein LTS00_004358 [Friedmanniomyces endolithicus]KAK0315840.1 hypothetical protein LTR01_001140 [Friedmanniomyces endolithicus]KAK0320712.1 hypothetical protein LTR82_008425 [Friedmanniomyces endolithicus]KAK0833710.1 hypothetical protein LTR73_001473 [Friedmanniomyces endolithicus]